MQRVKIIAVTVVLLCCLMLVDTSSAMNSGQYAINWSVVGAGGGPVVSSNYGLESTAGQIAVGQSDSASYDLCTGYWCEAAIEYKIYLPLVLLDT